MAWLLPAERPLGFVNLGVDTLAYAVAAPMLLGFQLIFYRNRGEGVCDHRGAAAGG